MISVSALGMCFTATWQLLLVIHNWSHWISTLWLIICSWKNTNKEILVIAPGSIVKINICFLLVSCCFFLFSKPHYQMLSRKVYTCLSLCSSCREYVLAHSCALAFLHKTICRINYWHDCWVYHYTLYKYWTFNFWIVHTVRRNIYSVYNFKILFSFFFLA